MFIVCVFHFTVTRYLVVGGEVEGGNNEMTEVVTLEKSNCAEECFSSYGRLPSKRRGAVGAMFGKAPILCGGNTGYSGTYQGNFFWNKYFTLNFNFNCF